MKQIKDFSVVSNNRLDERNVLLRLKPIDGQMPTMSPGQFVQVMSPAKDNTFLRLPISINNVEDDQLWLMVQMIGDGTKALGALREGDRLNLVLPLATASAPTRPRVRYCLSAAVLALPHCSMLARN